MIKTILVGIDGSEHSRAAEDYAIWLAGKLGATLTGMHVVDIVAIEGSFFHDISGSLGFEPYLDFTSKMREALQARGNSLLEDFSARCEARERPSHTALQIGIVPTELAERARESDLVVIGHRGVNHKFSAGMLGGVAENLIRQCTKPVLVTPQKFKPIESPLLAYDGSERASAAMDAAAAVCSELGLGLEVLTVGTDADKTAEITAAAERYLSSYALKLETRTIDGQAYEAIPKRVSEAGHDLVFMGSHGHSRIIEFVLGSTTEYVLRNIACPVFLSR
ncbi:MAG: universal stress protein [Deltaproteobacteria bacterium]